MEHYQLRHLANVRAPDAVKKLPELPRRTILKAAGYSALAALAAACGAGVSSTSLYDGPPVELKSNRSGLAGQTNDGQPLQDLLAAYQKETGRSVELTTVDHNAFQSNGNPLAYLEEMPAPDVL